MNFKSKTIKKVFILAIFAIALCIPFLVFSQGFGLPQTAQKAGYEPSRGDIYNTIGAVANVAFATVAFIFFGLTIYAGLRWVTARGKEDLIEKAKGTMESAIIGLIIVVLSYAIANFVISRVGSFSSESGCCIYADSCINVANQSDCIDGGAYYSAGSTECITNVDCPNEVNELDTNVEETLGCCCWTGHSYSGSYPSRTTCTQYVKKENCGGGPREDGSGYSTTEWDASLLGKCP